MRLPGGVEMHAPSPGRAVAGARHRARAGRPGGGRPAGGRSRPGRARRRGLRSLRGPRDAGHRQHRPGWTGRPIAPDRELPRLSGRDHRHGADEPRGRPGAEVRRPDGDALPGGVARARRRAAHRPPRGRAGDRRPRRAACDRRPVPPPSGRRPLRLRGPERLLRRRAARAAALRRLPGRRGRRRQLGGPGRGVAGARRRAGDAAAPARGPARDDVGLPDPRARSLRGRRARPQRDRRAARRRRATWRRSR